MGGGQGPLLSAAFLLLPLLLRESHKKKSGYMYLGLNACCLFTIVKRNENDDGDISTQLTTHWTDSIMKLADVLKIERTVFRDFCYHQAPLCEL